LKSGRTEIGRVIVVFFQKSITSDLLIPFSIVITTTKGGNGIFKNRRLIIFPRCDPLVPSVWRKGAKNLFAFNFDHVTYESDSCGKIKYHITGPKSGSSPTKHKTMGHSQNVSTVGDTLGFLIVKSASSMDSTGLIRARTSWQCKKDSLFTKVSNDISKATSGKHPIVSLADGEIWDDSSCLIIGISIAPHPFDGKYSPEFALDRKAFEIEKDEVHEIVMRTKSFQLETNLFLNLTSAVIPVKPLAEVIWMS
jgi:hypothetical protein